MKCFETIISKNFKKIKKKVTDDLFFVTIKFIELSDDFLHKPPPLPEFTDWSIVRTLFSIAATFFDHGTDIATAYVLYDDSTWWFRLTVTLIIVPNIFINAFSLYWYLMIKRSL